MRAFRRKCDDGEIPFDAMLVAATEILTRVCGSPLDTAVLFYRAELLGTQWFAFATRRQHDGEPGIPLAGDEAAMWAVAWMMAGEP